MGDVKDKEPFSFDEMIDRKNTGAVKYDFFNRYDKPADAIPLWIADMDFRVPPAVTQALEQMARHGVFGYTETRESYDEAVCGWYRRNFHWDVQPEWNIKTPGVVYSIVMAIRALSREGDSVLIQQPVYYPFMTTVQTNRRRLVVNELHLVRGRYEIDFDDFETLIIKNRVKLFLLCSPHNPVGRVWTREELRRMGAICLKHGVYILADEIHSDFVYSGYHHTVFADLDAALADRTITCTAPTKTFNLAGLQVANTFVADKKLRAKFKEECDMNGYNMLNTAGLVATEAAYTHGQSWRDALVAYLEDNVSYLRGALQGKRIELIQPEGTYLMWLDCRQLGLSDPQLDAFFTDQAKLWLHKGWTFGKCGSGFMRMNIACPRETLRQAMRNLEGVL